MNAQAREVALMCPGCKALVGGGSYDDETLAQIEAIAKSAGLQVLQMWLPEGSPNVEKCACNEPKPITRFFALMAMSSSFEMTIKDEKTGRYRKVTEAELQDWLGVPSFKQTATHAEGADELARICDSVAQKTGLSVRSLEIAYLDPVQLGERLRQRFTPVASLRVEGIDATFTVASHTKGSVLKRAYEVIVVEENGLQMWPNDTTQCMTTERKPKRGKELSRDVVIPFATALVSNFTNEKFQAKREEIRVAFEASLSQPAAQVPPTNVNCEEGAQD